MTNIQLSSRSDEWYTPDWLVDLVHQVLPTIDLDPASCEQANSHIRAKRIITKEQDALSTTWATSPATVYLNAPGGKIANKSSVAIYWQKLMDLRERGLLSEAIFMGFSLENLQVTQGLSCLSMADFPLVIPAKRIKFVSPAGAFNAPTHSNVIVYVPGIENNTSTFKAVFSAVGAVLHPSTVQP